MKLVYLFVALLASSSSFAADCVSQAEMQEIANTFTQFKDLTNKDYCFDGSETANLLKGIMFMRKTQFDAPMNASPDELFSGRFGSDWYQYFIGRINEFQVEASCPKGVGAFVYMFGGNTMHVCPMLLTDNFTALDRASVFMHEARHIDGFPHVTCSRGPRAGLQGACDDQISTAGSYAVTVETYAQISRYAKDLNPVLKAYSRASATTYAMEAFETPVRLNSSAQFLVMTQDKRFHLLKGKGTTKALGAAPALGRIVMRAQHMILFPEDKNLPSKYVFARNEGDIQQTAGDLSVDYNALSPSERSNMVDFHISAQWNARIFKDKIRFECDPRSKQQVDVNTNGVIPSSVIYPNGYDRSAPAAQFIDQNGKIFDFGCSNKQPSIRASSLVLDRPYKRMYKANDLLLGLTSDGHLYEVRGNSSTPFVTSLDGQIYEIAPNLNVDFFDNN